MHNSPLLDLLLRYRLDAVSLALLTLGACVLCRRLVKRRGAHEELPRFACAVLAALPFLGALAGDWFTVAIQFAPDSYFTSVVTVRALTLGATAFLITVLLASSTLVALMRAEIRRHSETEHQLQQAKNADDEANRAKGDFLAVMSHEIRTPLNAVMGFANLLSETKLDDAQRNYLGTITGEGSRLSSLINDILDLSKIDEGRLVLERLPFAPSETTAEVLRLLAARAQEKNVSLRFEAQLCGPLLISGDPLRFRQIVLNLVDNALKFTPQGTVTVFLTWAPPPAGVPHGTLGVRVCDSGIGIPLEKQGDLFQMFMQADVSTTRRYGGTGLGLAICQRLVALMGGKIAVTSTPGQGSIFSFEIPATTVSLPDSPDETLPAITAPTRRPRILVVDDIQTNLFLLEIFLQRSGFDPDLASGGEEAIRLALAHRYDAILMDLHMPDLDGFSATKRIRAAEPAGQHTPIIALTAAVGRGTREKCLAVGMDEHLSKPLDLTKFKTLLGNFIAQTIPPAAHETAAPIEPGANLAV